MCVERHRRRFVEPFVGKQCVERAVFFRVEVLTHEIGHGLVPERHTRGNALSALRDVALEDERRELGVDGVHLTGAQLDLIDF